MSDAELDEDGVWMLAHYVCFTGDCPHLYANDCVEALQSHMLALLKEGRGQRQEIASLTPYRQKVLDLVRYVKDENFTAVEAVMTEMRLMVEAVHQPHELRGEQ